ncbi:MAG TPA: cation:proton antiporter [Myxococcota bacterium]|nr:cation:proton antiporter [Myxococcota bacterium]
MEELGPTFVFALALGAGVFAQAVARHLSLPSIVPLLATGVALGPDGLDWIRPEALGGGLVGLVLLAVAVILFEGALNLDLRRLRREARSIRMLVTVGALVTAVGGALAAHGIMGWGWSRSVLFGTLVIVTGPTVVRPILRNIRLSPRVATVLEAEGVLIDPIGALVAAVALQVVLEAASTGAFSIGLSHLGRGLGFGAVAGLLGGSAIALLLRWPRVVPEGLENVVTLGMVMLLFAGCEAHAPDSGILAVTLAGVVVGNAGTRVGRELREFNDHLTLALLALLFVLLAADVRLADVVALGWPGLAAVAALVFVVRPVNVLVSTLASDLSWRERAFLSWIAPRGIVAAAVASIFAASLAAHGLPGGTELRALVFLTIAVTVLVQGGTGPLVARLLRVRAPERDVVVILGAEDFGLALGELLRSEGVPVGFVDSNPSHTRAAQERDFPVTYGNALQESVMMRARLPQARAVVGLTPNDEVNSLFAREAREDFGVPDTFAAINRVTQGMTPELLEKRGSRMLFDGPKDVERWNVRFRHGIARLERYHWVGRPDGAKAPPKDGSGDGLGRRRDVDPYVILAIARGGRWQVMHSGLTPRTGDVAVAALHEPEADEAQLRLARAGWAPGDDAEPEDAEAADASLAQAEA